MMNTLKNSIYILFVIILFTVTSLAQNKTRLDISPGVLKDTNNNFGLNIKLSRLLTKSPLSFSLGLGFFKTVHREGINQFNYEYYQNQNIVPAFSLNYEFFKSDKSLSLEVSPRVSYFLNKKEFYTSKYNASKNINEITEKNVLTNNLSIGTGLNIKKTSRKEVSLVLSMGLDYLVGDKSRWNKNLLLGIEFPLIANKNQGLSSKKVYAPKVIKPVTDNDFAKKEINNSSVNKVKDSVVEAQKKNISIAKKDTLKVVSQTLTDNLEKLSKDNEKQLLDTLIAETNNIQKKPKVIREPIVISKTKENVVKNDDIVSTEKIKKDTLKVKVPPVIKIPKKDRKVLNESVQTEEIQAVKLLKVLGPLNIDGIQYELGDDWNYWLGENGYWYAKKKTKEKWYDLIKSLNDDHYDKAVQTLSRDAKKVD